MIHRIPLTNHFQMKFDARLRRTLPSGSRVIALHAHTSSSGDHQFALCTFASK